MEGKKGKRCWRTFETGRMAPLQIPDSWHWGSQHSWQFCRVPLANSLSHPANSFFRPFPHSASDQSLPFSALLSRWVRTIQNIETVRMKHLHYPAAKNVSFSTLTSPRQRMELVNPMAFWCQLHRPSCPPACASSPPPSPPRTPCLQCRRRPHFPPVPESRLRTYLLSPADLNAFQASTNVPAKDWMSQWVYLLFKHQDFQSHTPEPPWVLNFSGLSSASLPPLPAA